MKKRIFIFIGVLILISLIIFGMFKLTKSKDSSKITLSEVTHSVFYTPMYVAIEQGYFKQENIDIELLLTPGADKVSAAVLSGDAQIGFAGAESAMYIYNSNKDDYLQIFGGLTKRDGQFIVSRSNSKFDWNDLKGKEILVGRKGGMPALNFINALKNAGLSENDVNLNYSIDFASLSGAFIGGQGDYVNLFEPNATLLEEEGFGYVLQSVGKKSGEFPYTVFYAKKEFINNNKDLLKKFNKAINKGLAYVLENDSFTIANAISNQFPDTNIDELAKMIKRYKENDCWLSNTYISETLFNNLSNFLKENNLIDSNIPYKDLVLNI